MWKLGIYSICFCRCCRKGLHFNCLDFPDPELIRELSKDRILAIDWGVFVSGEQISGLPRVNDFRARSPRFTLEAMEANQAVVEAVEQLATAKCATAAQVALAWLLARGPRIVPIFGTRRLDRVKENLGAAEVRLSDEDMAAIEACLARIEVTGERLPPAIRLLSSDCPTANHRTRSNQTNAAGATI
jgi:aryl-alcohol dehydrogenase-like predicted oxidoreductase